MNSSIEDLKFQPHTKAALRLYEKLASVRTDIEIYIQGKNDDNTDPYPRKDHPKMDRHNNLRHSSSNKDPLHQAEHRISLAMHEMLSQLETVKSVSPRHKQYLQAVTDFRTLAEELTDLKIFLDQGKNYANKKTMPEPDDDASKPAQPKGHKALFTRLNDLGLDAKSR